MTAPLTPADCDLSDFPFMPLHVAKLRRSKAWLKAKRQPELGFYMLNLWMAAWHETPAASLEDDEDVLADAAGCPPDRWRTIQDTVLAGWVKCSDGRLYHPFVAEQAAVAWASKLERKAFNEHETERKRREREERAELFATLRARGAVPPWNTKMAELRTMAADLSAGQAKDVRGVSRLREGQGQGQGQGQGDSSKPPSGVGAAKTPRPARKPPADFKVTPDLVKWAAEKAPSLAIEVLESETEKFRDHTFGNAITDWPGAWRNWMRRTAEGRPVWRNGVRVQGDEPGGWWGTKTGLEAKGKELNIPPPADDSPHAFARFKARIWVAAGDGPWWDEHDAMTFPIAQRLRNEG